MLGQFRLSCCHGHLQLALEVGDDARKNAIDHRGHLVGDNDVAAWDDMHSRRQKVPLGFEEINFFKVRRALEAKKKQAEEKVQRTANRRVKLFVTLDRQVPPDIRLGHGQLHVTFLDAACQRQDRAQILCERLDEYDTGLAEFVGVLETLAQGALGQPHGEAHERHHIGLER